MYFLQVGWEILWKLMLHHILICHWGLEWVSGHAMLNLLDPMTVILLSAWISYIFMYIVSTEGNLLWLPSLAWQAVSSEWHDPQNNHYPYLTTSKSCFRMGPHYWGSMNLPATFENSLYFLFLWKSQQLWQKTKLQAPQFEAQCFCDLNSFYYPLSPPS